MPPSLMLPTCRTSSGKYMTSARQHDRDQLDNLNGARRAAEDVADFEVLQQLARHRRRHADHRRDASIASDSGRARYAQAHHQQRGDDHGGKRQAGDRIVRRADKADEAARTPSRRRSPRRASRASPRCRRRPVPDEVDVEERHQHGRDADQQRTPSSSSCSARCARACAASGAICASSEKRAAQPADRLFRMRNSV